MGIEQHGRRALRNDIGERDRFLDHALAGVVGAAFPDFDDFDVAQTEIAAGLRRALRKRSESSVSGPCFRRPMAATMMRIARPALLHVIVHWRLEIVAPQHRIPLHLIGGENLNGLEMIFEVCVS